MSVGQVVSAVFIFATVFVFLSELIKTLILGARMRIAGAKWTTKITKGPEKK